MSPVSLFTLLRNNFSKYYNNLGLKNRQPKKSLPLGPHRGRQLSLDNFLIITTKYHLKLPEPAGFWVATLYSILLYRRVFWLLPVLFLVNSLGDSLKRTSKKSFLCFWKYSVPKVYPHSDNFDIKRW